MFWTLLALAGLVLVGGGCDAMDAPVLDGPQVLAIRADPPGLRPGEEQTLTALIHDGDGSVSWRACASAWTAQTPVACPDGDATLGQGNPLATNVPADAEAWWVRVDAPPALSAVALLEPGVVGDNPEVTGIATASGPLPPRIAGGVVLDLVPAFGPGVVAEDVVVTWFTTGGALSPARTVGTEPAQLEAPASGEVRIYAVARAVGGGVGWAEALVGVDP